MYKLQKSKFHKTSNIRTLVVSTFVAAFIMLFMAGVFEVVSLSIFKSGNGYITIGSTVAMILNVIVSAFVMCKISKIKFQDLGWHREGAIKEIFQGVVIGLAAISSVALLIFMLGGIKFEYIFTTKSISPMILGFIFFMFQGTFEELVMRSYLMPNFANVMGDKWSIIITSILFSVLHFANPGITVIPIINLVLFGIVFAALYYKTGSLWVCGISHGVWNYTMAYVYGAEVSGALMGSAVLHSIPQAGKDFISGGKFGYEGGIVTTIVGIILIILIFKFYNEKEVSA